MFFAVNVLAPLMDRDDRDTGKHTPQRLRPERRRNLAAVLTERVLVRLTRKYAEMIDGVNLEHFSVGDRLELTPRDANILIAEGWAVRADDERRGQTLPQRSLAADSSAGHQKPKS